MAGVFLLSSPQPSFFSQRLQDLLQVYAYLLGLAFETDRFYPPERIGLRPMPAERIQRAYILSGSVAKCSGNVIEWNMKKHRSTKGIAKNHPYVSSYRPTPSSPD